MYYSSFGLLAVVVIIIINIQSMRRPKDAEEAPVHTRYRQFLWSLTVFCLADIMWGIVYDWRIMVLAYFDTTMFFATMGITVFLWMRYIVSFLNRKSVFSKILTYSGGGIFAFLIVMLMINNFYPVFFKFDENNEYIPGKARYALLGLQVLLFAATAVYPLAVSAKSQNRKTKLRCSAVGFSGIIMTAFIILQTMDPFAPFYAVGCLLSTSIIHTFVEMDEKEERDREIGSFKRMAYRDSLTDVRNNAAYTESKILLDQLVKDGSLKDFGVVIFDINNLKTVNDTLGHEAGDKYIQNGCKLICNTFKHSPVFRIGGDEFIAILEGEDYRERGVLVTLFNDKVENNIRNGGVAVACGMSAFDPATDKGFDDVFERADRKMYERKNILKSKGVIKV